MKELYIFVDSERPDQYVNSVSHCALELDVRNITFLHIKRLTSGEGSRENSGLSARVLAAVQAQIENLAERHEYVSRSDGQRDIRLDLRDEYGEGRAKEIAGYYKRLRQLPLNFSNKEIEYSLLREVLAEIAAKKSAAYLDITAVKKRYLGDIVSAGLVEGVVGLWTFDLLVEKPDFSRPWQMLIHDLIEPHGRPRFQYTNVLDTETYKACRRLVFVRSPRYQLAAAVTIGLLVAGGLGFHFLGESSAIVKSILAVSGVASIISLFLVFWSPRLSG